MADDDAHKQAALIAAQQRAERARAERAAAARLEQLRRQKENGKGGKGR